ncbi:MAG: YjgP/YjgQ family permease [PVC group bacterium]|nr:YjgP/YjgQ family permease [PVC group bacterium]
MKIIKNYILSEWFSLLVLSIVVISFVLVVGNLVKLAEMIIAKGVTPKDVFGLFLSLLPSLLVFSIPISILTATLLTFGRMAFDNEITALRSSGISLYSIIFSLLCVGIMFSLLCLYFNDSLIPKSHYTMRNIVQEIGIKKPTAYLEEKSFIKAFKNHIIFIYKIHDDTMYDVRIYQPHSDKPTRTIIAQSGAFIPIPEKNALKLELRNGTADEPNFEDPEQFYKFNFKKYHLTLYLNEEQTMRELYKKVSDMTINELKNEIEAMKKINVDVTPLIVGLYRKFSLSFSSLAFVLIGMPLAIRVKRRERSLGFGLSLVICLLYYLIMALGESLALRGKMDPVLGVWLPNIVLLVAGIFLTFKVLED